MATLMQLLERLEALKTSFRPPDGERVLKVLNALSGRGFPDAASLVRFHEALLFLRAYPHSRAVHRVAGRLLDGFHRRVSALREQGVDLSEMEEPEISGIAGTGLSAVFSYGVARHLARRHHTAVEIDPDYYQKADAMGRALARLLPLLEEDSLVEAVVPYREWLRRACGDRGSLRWLLERLSRTESCPRRAAEIYDSLELLLRWELDNSRATRTRGRLPVRKVFVHQGPLLRRSDVSLDRELASPPLPVTRLSRAEGEKILALARDTSAVRYRELHGFTFGEAARVLRAEAGRGVTIYVMGVPPLWRLPLRAYHGGVFFKNGVPVGYVEGLSLFERMEVGFNLYYTFREGESAWLYARTLRLFRQLFGISCFAIDPYQIGYRNEEAIESGAFWFYRKLGFRPVAPEQAALCAREEEKLRRYSAYRSRARALRNLAKTPMIYEFSRVCSGDWDRFQVRNLGLAVQRRMQKVYGGDADRMRGAAAKSVAGALGVAVEDWPPPAREAFENLALVLNLIPELARWSSAEKVAAARVLRAKGGRDEARYLKLMQQHSRLRAAFLRLGSRA